MTFTERQLEAVKRYRALVAEGVKKKIAAERVGFSRVWIAALDKQLAAQEKAEVAN